jgi:hypothetical protein
MIRRLTNLQLAGPLVLFGAVLAAELSAWGLSRAPTSELLWYLNLKWFPAFQRIHYMLSDYISMSYFQLIGIALPILILALAGWAWQKQLPLALASNLSFIYAASLVYFWCDVGPFPRTASAVLINIRSGPDLYLFAVLISASVVSFVISHFAYLRSMQAQTQATKA